MFPKKYLQGEKLDRLPRVPYETRVLCVMDEEIENIHVRLPASF